MLPLILSLSKDEQTSCGSPREAAGCTVFRLPLQRETERYFLTTPLSLEGKGPGDRVSSVKLLPPSLIEGKGVRGIGSPWIPETRHFPVDNLPGQLYTDTGKLLKTTQFKHEKVTETYFAETNRS